VVGVDLGSRRIGVAVSDAGGRLASPVEVLERSGDPDRDRQALARLIDELEGERVVVGLPLSLDGSIGPAARAALDEVEALAAHTAVPIETYDERFTTVTADHLLRQQRTNARQRRTVIDKAAAAVLLQSWLDGRATDDPTDASAPPAASRPDETRD
jgi:putative Holliday junction resolvase